MPVYGLDWLAPVRSFRNFFGRYGTTSGSIRGVLNGIVPVAVVDRYRDDSEGSLFGLTATAVVPSAGPNYPAFVFGSSSEDWELLQASVGWFWGSGNPSSFRWLNMMVYTPDVGYNPLQNPSPAGIYVPGLNTDWSYTLSSVVGIAGYNTTVPTRFGFFPFQSLTKGSTSTYTSVDFQKRAWTFDPPLRVYRDVTLGMMAIEQFGKDIDVTVSILYRVRPRTTDGPRTGTP